MNLVLLTRYDSNQLAVDVEFHHLNCTLNSYLLVQAFFGVGAEANKFNYAVLEVI